MLGAVEDEPSPTAADIRPSRRWSRWPRLVSLALAALLGGGVGAYVTANSGSGGAADSTSVRLSAIYVGAASTDVPLTTQVQVLLRNQGHRALTVYGGRLAGVDLSSQVSLVPAGGMWVGYGTLSTDCGSAIDLSGPLMLFVSSATGESRATSLVQGRDFRVEGLDTAATGVCAAASFDQLSFRLTLVSSTRRGRAQEVQLVADAMLPLPGLVAHVTGLRVQVPGVRTLVRSGLPVTLTGPATLPVTLDLSVPNCPLARLPQDLDARPLVVATGTLRRGEALQTAGAYDANALLVAVLHLLARDCPGQRVLQP